MIRYYDRKGHPMELMEWARALELGNRVRNDTIADQRVSTIWLGLDYRFDEGPPLIFETMVFGGPYGQYCKRYSTEEAAIAGHDQTVTALREGREPA